MKRNEGRAKVPRAVRHVVLLMVMLGLAPVAWAQAQFDVVATPRSLSMAAGTLSTINVTTQTNATTPASATSIVYSIHFTNSSGQDVGITTDSPKTAMRSGSSVTPVTFMVSVPPNTPAGTYSTPLMGRYEYSPGNFTDYMFDVLQLKVTAAQPGFSFFTSNDNPSVGTTSPATVTFTTNVDPGFSGPITYQFTPGASFLVVTPSTQTINAPYSPFSIQISANPSDPSFRAGTFAVNVVATGGGQTLTHTLNVTVTAPPPDFTLVSTPSTVTLAQGGSQTVTLSVQPSNGFNAPVTVSASSSRSDVTITPSTFTIAPGATQPVTLTATSSAVPGSADVSFTATAAGVTGPRTAKTAVVVQAPAATADFAVNVSANPPQVAQGQSTQLTFTATAINGFSGTITITPRSTAGVAFSPATITLTPGQSRIMTATVTNAPTGLATLAFSATSGALQHDAQTVITVVAAPASGTPELTSVTPPSIVRGAPPVTLRVAGTNFVSGAQVFADSGDVIVQSTRVINDHLADVTVLARRDIDLRRPYRLRLRNPNGVTTPVGVPLFVYAEDAIGAASGVRAAAIVSPVEGTIVGSSQPIHPRALIATTGSGTLYGQWRLDGVAYESFVATAQAGMPVEVRGLTAIPAASWGEHTLTLAVASKLEDLAPASTSATVAPSVLLVSARESRSSLMLYAPAERIIIGREAPEFRWTLLPGASGYRVEFANDEGVVRIAFRTSSSKWTPTRAQLQSVGAGTFRWRVVPVYTGEVEGTPSEWRPVVVLPEAVSLRAAPRGGTVAWTGGAPGVVYHLDVLDAGGSLLFRALAVRPRYDVPAFARASAASVRITPSTPQGDVLGQAVTVKLGAMPASHAVTPSVTNLHVDQDGGVVRATWSGRAPAGTVTLFADDTDVTPLARISESSLEYQPLLASDAQAVRVAIGQATAQQVVATPSSPATPQASTQHHDYTLAPMGDITVVHDSTNSVHAQFTGQGDLAGGSNETKFTSDLSYRGANEPRSLRQESRNWIGSASAKQGTFSEEAVVGYTSPDFLDGAEFLTSGVARTGVTAKAHSSFGSISYYQPVNTAVHGIVSGDPQNLKIRTLALETPAGKPYLLRAIGLEVTDPGQLGLAGSRLRTFGLFGKYDVSPRLSLVAEAGHGAVSERCTADDVLTLGCTGDSRGGIAARIGLTGQALGASYALNLRHVGPNFVNPSNRGLTSGGVSDRTSLDLNVGRNFGLTNVNVSVRRQDSGRSSESQSARASQDALNIAVNRSFARRYNLSLSSQFSRDLADASDRFFTPETHRSQSGINGSLSETFGRFNVSEMLSWQRAKDRVNPLSDTTTTMAGVNAGGTVTSWFTISGSLNATRSAASPVIGRTTMYTASLQPSITLPSRFITLQPRVAYNRSTNDLTHFASDGEQYGAILQFSPPWASSLVSGQLSADWNANGSEMPGVARTHQFTRRYQAVMNVRWSGLHGGSIAQVPASVTPDATAAAIPH